MTKNSALGESVGRSAGTLGVYPGGLQTHCTVVCLICQVLIFFVDICVSHGHNSCVGWFEISTSPRFRNIFCKKRVCGYTNSHLHPLKTERMAMYTAMLLLCSMYSPGECIQATDSKGPYPTEEECQVRIEEMATDTRLLFPYLITAGVRCAYDGGEST